jgi:hypothetical protein
MLIDLIERLTEQGIEVISANTDGLFLRVKRGSRDWRGILAQWEADTGMTLDIDQLKRLAILASNQYATRDRRDKVKRKGGDLKGSFSWQQAPNMLVINDAVAKALLFDDPPERTIFACRELARFCSICTRGNAAALELADGDNVTALPKVTRWYRSKDGSRRIARRFPDGRRVTIPGAQSVTICQDIPEDGLPADLDWSWYLGKARRTIQGVPGYRHRSPRRLQDHAPAIEVHRAGLIPVPKRCKEQPAGSDVKHPTMLWDWSSYPTVGVYTGPAVATLVLDVDDPAKFRKFIEAGNSPMLSNRWKSLETALVSYHGDATPEGVRDGRHRGKLIFQFDGDKDHPLGRVKSRWKDTRGVEVFYGNGLPSILGEYDGNGDRYCIDGTLGKAPDWLVAAFTPKQRPSVKKTPTMAPEARQAALEGLPAVLADLAPELGQPSIGWRRKDVADGREIWVARCPFEHDSGRSEDGDLSAGYHDDGPYVRCMHSSCSRVPEINRRLKEHHEREHPTPPAPASCEPEEAGDPPATTITTTTTAAPPAPADEEKPAQAVALVRLAQSAALWHTPDGRAYATLPINGHSEHHEIYSDGMKDWLTRAFYVAYGRPPTGEAMQQALNVLRAQARYDGPKQPVHVRIAAADDAYVLDLCDTEWRSVAIRPKGWEIVAQAPAYFRRPDGLLALPEPRRGGKVELLKAHVNVQEEDFVLLVAWLTAAMKPTGPYPVLALTGEQGSSKSTLARMLRQLCDPHVCPLRAEPRDPRDLMIAASNSWVVVHDNISTISPWLSDALCRLATGGGYATRTLYSNGEETFMDAQRPVILNGIVDYATRGDLIDRCLFLHLPPIPESKRRPEAEVRRLWEADYPLILGALLDAVAGAMRILPSVKLANLPRMADFAIWGHAVCLALGWNPESFTRSYEANRQHAQEAILEDSPVSTAVRSLVADSGTWTGTATEVLAALEEIAGEKIVKTNRWPKSPRKLSGELRELAPTLRMAGIEIVRGRKAGGNRDRTITITRTPDGTGNLASLSSQPSQIQQNRDPNRDATRDGGTMADVAASLGTPGKDGIRDDRDGRDGEIPDLSGEPPF